jgi:hypothetical protein
MVDGHEGEGRVDRFIHHRDVQLILGIDRGPVRLARASQRIHRQFETGVTLFR